MVTSKPIDAPSSSNNSPISPTLLLSHGTNTLVLPACKVDNSVTSLISLPTHSTYSGKSYEADPSNLTRIPLDNSSPCGSIVITVLVLNDIAPIILSSMIASNTVASGLVKVIKMIGEESSNHR